MTRRPQTKAGVATPGTAPAAGARCCLVGLQSVPCVCAARRTLAWALTLALLACGAVGSNDASCGTHYTPNATRLLQPPSKSGFGVIFVASHGDPEKARHFVGLAIESAASYKRASPRVPRALITSAPRRALPSACDRAAERVRVLRVFRALEVAASDVRPRVARVQTTTPSTRWSPSPPASWCRRTRAPRS